MAFFETCAVEAGYIQSMRLRNWNGSLLHSVVGWFMSFLDNIKKPDQEPPAGFHLIEPFGGGVYSYC